MTYEIVHKVKGKVKYANGHYISDCPSCRKESHFYLNKSTGFWDCKKCGAAGNYFQYVKLVNGDIDSIRDLIKTKVDIFKVKRFDEKEVIEENFPTTFLPIKKGDPYYNYFVKVRKFPARYINEYALFYTHQYEFNYRDKIVTPIPDEKGYIKGYVARSIFEQSKLRYYNSKGTEFSKLLFNYRKVKRSGSDLVIVVEGVFDSMRLGSLAVSTFGKKISEHQLSLLYKLKKKEVVLMFDEDVEQKIWNKYSYELKQAFDNVSRVYLPHSDPDKFFRKYNDEQKLDFVLKNRQVISERKLKRIGL